MSMNEPATISTPLTMPEKLVLARQAFRDFHTQCFWFMREDAQIGEENIETVVRGLRSHGNREAFFIAAQLCR